MVVLYSISVRLCLEACLGSWLALSLTNSLRSVGPLVIKMKIPRSTSYRLVSSVVRWHRLARQTAHGTAPRKRTRRQGPQPHWSPSPPHHNLFPSVIPRVHQASTSSSVTCCGSVLSCLQYSCWTKLVITGSVVSIVWLRASSDEKHPNCGKSSIVTPRNTIQ